MTGMEHEAMGEKEEPVEAPPAFRENCEVYRSPCLKVDGERKACNVCLPSLLSTFFVVVF